VLILGATGNAGQMAVQVAKHLGASRVIAVGRDADRLALLAELGADQTISLLGDDDAVDHDLGRAAARVDLSIELRSAWLRAVRVDIVGSGQGSVHQRRRRRASGSRRRDHRRNICRVPGFHTAQPSSSRLERPDGPRQRIVIMPN
jgi:hypothetical protein